MFSLEKIVRKNILSLTAYSSARDEYKGEANVFLDANENPFGTLNRYPDPQQSALKNALSNLKNIPSDRVFIGNGSDEVIDLAFRIFCSPGKDKALCFSPTYGMYDVAANINNIALLKTPLTADFQINMTELKPYLKYENLKLIFICSPNNPTGNSLKTNDIEYILNNFNGIVVLDEAYIDFSPAASWNTKIAEYPNLIVSQTFSKAWGLAAARVGVAYAHQNTIALFNKVKPPYNISSLNEKAALNVLKNEKEFEENKRKILLEKKRVIAALSNLKIVQKVYPSDANFLLIAVDNANDMYSKLVAKKIIIRNRNTLIKNCLRITIGSAAENNKLINELKNY